MALRETHDDPPRNQGTIEHDLFQVPPDRWAQRRAQRMP